jgi:integrase
VSGMRDLVILLLLARLGLRAAEVAGLELEDFYRRAGAVAVRGKAGRRDRMPLPPRAARRSPATCSGPPGGRDRVVFSTLRPPPRPMGHITVSQVVWRQCRIAGVGTPPAPCPLAGPAISSKNTDPTTQPATSPPDTNTAHFKRAAPMDHCVGRTGG